MITNLDEIAPNIYRLSTFVSEIGPTGLTFNQFLLDDEEPLLFHTGHRSMFPSISKAMSESCRSTASMDYFSATSNPTNAVP